MKRPLRITYVIGSLDRGGAEGHLVAVVPRMDRSAFAPEVFTLSAPGERAAEITAAGVPVITPWLPNRSGASVAYRAMRLGVTALQLFLHLALRRPRIVHAFLPAATLIALPLAGLAGIRCRVMSRRSRNHYMKKHLQLAKLELRLHRHTTALLANSRRVAEDLLEEGAPPERVGLIYNGISLPEPQPEAKRWETRRSLGIPEEALALIVVANLIPYKGHGDLLQACARLDSEGPDWRLLLVGRDDGIGGDLAKEAERLGIMTKVSFLGSRRDVPTLLQASDIGILPSYEEGFSNALLEGMAAGLPMVATDVGGNAEAVVDSETGFIVPPHNPPALATALERLRHDSARRSTFGAAGRARVEERFFLLACVKRYEELYRALAAGETGVPATISATRSQKASVPAVEDR